jgi:hypothetical protein
LIESNDDYTTMGLTKPEDFYVVMRNLLEENLINWVPITSRYNGMVSTVGIYLSKQLFIGFNDRTVSAKIVLVFIHEALHYVTRYKKKDFTYITPRHRNLPDLDSGYLIEYLLFGTYEHQIWNSHFEEILNPSTYCKKIPILNGFDDRPKDRVIYNPSHSGLSEEQQEIEGL